MAQQRGKRAVPSKAAVANASASAPDPPPFFSMGPATFTDAIVITKVISVVLPLRHLRDRNILHTTLLKKLLHRPYEASAEDLAQQQLSQQATDDGGKHGRGAHSALDNLAAPTSSSSSTPYVIVHIKSAEIHADTARQVNPRGDVQVNVMVTLVAARLQHGICAGVSEASPFTSCMQVRVPTVAVSAAVAARGSTDDAATLLLRDASEAGTDNVSQEGVKDAKAEPSGGDAALDASVSATTTAAAAKRSCCTGVPEDQQLRVTARCLEDEPIVPGQAVLLISEPAAMRCMGIRPPRAAPGPFYLTETTQPSAQFSSGEAEGGPEARPKKRARKSRASAGGTGGATPARRIVSIECAIPKREEDGEGGAAAGTRKGPRKRPHT
uniref:ICAM-L protein n=2 Tax=Leishmania TaxID=5658 RepID=Q7KB84_LEIMA|nr:ICAM-L protein [Leishmania major]AAM70415.1 ICAM-L protein [Leishmania gerbilli]